MRYESLFLCALALTVAVESAAIVTMLRVVSGLRREKYAMIRIAAAGVLPSVATLPYLWFVLPAFMSGYHFRVAIGEVAVFFVEAALLDLLLGVRARYAALLSVVANCASIIAGLAVFR